MLKMSQATGFWSWLWEFPGESLMVALLGLLFSWFQGVMMISLFISNRSHVSIYESKLFIQICHPPYNIYNNSDCSDWWWLSSQLYNTVIKSIKTPSSCWISTWPLQQVNISKRLQQLEVWRLSISSKAESLAI